MDPMTEMEVKVEQGVSEFYDRLAPDYDGMTGFEKRFVQERPFFRLLVERFGITSALDAGCGTGFHSLLLAQLGVDVTAVDVSRNMIDILQRHAHEMKLSIRAVESTFHDMPEKLHTQYDAVFAMGNTLAHLLSREDLLSTLKAFQRILKSNGLLFLQNLNYDRILAKRDSIQSVKEHQGTIFVRYYEYGPDAIQFQILKIEKVEGNLQHELITVTLRPILREELVQLLTLAGFGDIKVHGGIAMEEFDAESSKDLVVLAHKN
jgi:2-polyprenyl-3-methyl-5-hydroxy-6-metoxy-1,4-benzoquinol methylase